MSLGMVDKLFFMKIIDTDIIVDFGCADGTILKEINKLNPNIKLIGYDIDDEMLNKARLNINNTNVILTSNWQDIESLLLEYKSPTLLLSSVIHEVYSYTRGSNVKYFWNKQVFGGLFKFICIRDMIPSSSMEKESNFISDVDKVRKISNDKYLKSFESIWGDISSNYRTFIHFLLKYKYISNWEREVNENYVPLTIETLLKKIPVNYKVKYQTNYILPHLYNQVYKDFKIKIKENTHVKMVIERT